MLDARPAGVAATPPAIAAGLSTMKSHHDLDKPASTRSRTDGVHEALHDDFFDAGEQGLYEGGHGASSHHVVDEELEHDAPRLIVRTPEQELRRNRMMRVVGVVVGVVLGVLVFAVLRGRGASPEYPKPRPTGRVDAVSPPAAIEPPPPPVVTPPAPPPVVTPPPEPETVTPPTPTRAPPAAEAKPPVEKPAPNARPQPDVAASPKPRPAPEPKPRPSPAPAQPAPQPAPAGKPPTVSFPD